MSLYLYIHVYVYVYIYIYISIYIYEYIETGLMGATWGARRRTISQTM